MPVDQVDQFAARVGDSELSDRELLKRFEVRHDEVAFAAILQRHGAMVLRVCQRVLERREDAEDAFQATFLVLARKAGTVTWQESIGTWLHATAQRLASEVRRTRTRRQIRESLRVTPSNGDALDEVTSRELLAILDEELTSLPEDLRGPLLLCCMEGMTGDEAANQLGCSPSTVKRRLRDARELLQAKLSRRGITLSMTAMIALLAANTATANLPSTLASTTLKAAVLFKSGALTPGLVSTQAIQLTRLLLPAISAKAKLLIGTLFVAGIIGVVAVVAGRGLERDGSNTEDVQVAPQPPAEVQQAQRVAGPVVLATVETTLRTDGAHIRQFAFDGNTATYFASIDPPNAEDHFTLVFDKPVALNSVSVRTGTPDGDRALQSGRLEVSVDGKIFEPLSTFNAGTAQGKAGGRELRAVRVQPTVQRHTLVIREFTIDSDSPVAVFRHPVEFAVDTSDAPELTKWANRAARVCERAYPMICDELAADGFTPPTRIPFTVRRDATSIVYASEGRITASAWYFEANPHDIGAVVHTASFVVQAYRGRSSPSWLVQGIADYIRFFKFEPDVLGPADPDTARYDGNSRETATFLAYLVSKYDPAIVRRLNAVLRDGRYDDDIWISLTGKPLRELGDEWHRSLRR